MKVDYSRSIEELEQDFWGVPSFKSTLALKCHDLRKVALSKLNVGDLRLLIGQEIGLEFLIPMALEILENNILAEGDLYVGDLLTAVALVNDKFWFENPTLNNRLVEITFEVESQLETLQDVLPKLKKRKFV